MPWTTLCDISELTEGKGKYVEIGGFQLAVFLSAGEIYAMDNTCPHAGGNLAAGQIETGCVVCPLHFWAFHLESGALRDAPGCVVRTYPIRLLNRNDGTTLVQANLPGY